MERVNEIARQIRWYWSSLMGDNHYQRYLAHRGCAHAGKAVITERDYWRLRHDAAATEPRCC